MTTMFTERDDYLDNWRVVQTFLISTDFDQTAQSLDKSRLNKQLLEGRQILHALAGRSKGWVYHPATKMWRGHELFLHDYLTSIMVECASRGVKVDTNWAAIESVMSEFTKCSPPDWYTDLVTADRIITSHRAQLFFKNPEHYSDFWVDAKIFESNRTYFTCCDRCNYYWPTHIM